MQINLNLLDNVHIAFGDLMFYIKPQVENGEMSLRFVRADHCEFTVENKALLLKQKKKEGKKDGRENGD